MSRWRRRDFLRLGGAVAAGSWIWGGPFEWARASGAPVVSGEGPFGPLQEPDENGIRLPEGFRSRVLAEARFPVAPSSYEWHPFPDGGATFPVQGGWVYVSNSELPLTGGVGALRFDQRGEVIDAYRTLDGTTLNCAGGATPWGTWLSCEEFEAPFIAGHVFECDPLGRSAGVERRALGGFQHEAVAADPIRRRLYLTEDQGDGCLYRFTPEVWGDLTRGLFEVAQVVDDGSPPPGGGVVWHEVPVPDPALGSGDDPTRYQVAEAAHFRGGEGIVYQDGLVHFTTKGDNRVWQLDVVQDSLCVLYDVALDPGRQLSGVDNITVSPFGDLYVAEDGGNMELVMLSVEGVAAPLLKVEGQDRSELTGPAFDPWERRLYVSSQRGGREGLGITYEISGPFRQRLHC